MMAEWHVKMAFAGPVLSHVLLAMSAILSLATNRNPPYIRVGNIAIKNVGREATFANTSRLDSILAVPRQNLKLSQRTGLAGSPSIETRRYCDSKPLLIVHTFVFGEALPHANQKNANFAPLIYIKAAPLAMKVDRSVLTQKDV
jgi:hypothetical protein